MSKYPVLVIAMVLMAGIFHMMFIMFDYGFNDPDSGGFNKLSDAANNSMNSEYKTRTTNTANNLRQFFGLGRVIIIGLCIAIAILGVLKSRGGGYNE